MKRITKQMKLLDLIASLFNLLYVIIASTILIILFGVLEIPAQIDQAAPQIEYYVFGLTLWTSQVNVIMGTLVAFLVFYVPLTFQGFKRVLNKEDVEIDKWHYRHQYLLSFFDFVTLNFVASVIRFLLAQEISYVVSEYGFLTSLKNTLDVIVRGIQKVGTWFALQYKKLANFFLTKILKKDEKYVIEQGTKEQEDIEKLNRSAFLLKVTRTSVTYVFLTFMALFIFVPFYWMIITALKDNYSLVNDMSPSFFLNPADMQWVNFKYVLTVLEFEKYIFNTLFVGLTTMAGTVIITILAAFSFSRLEWKSREFIFSILLMTMMIPGELYTITNYITASNLGWVKSDQSFYALIIPFLTSVFYIFFLRQTFRQIPDSLYRAARVDGCSDFKYLTRVMIPIAAPTIITIVILSAMGAWDAYIWPQLVAGKDHWLISVALRQTGFTVGVGADARPLANLQVAAAAMVTVPLLIVFFSLKRYIVTGVGRAGIKG